MKASVSFAAVMLMFLSTLSGTARGATRIVGTCLAGTRYSTIQPAILASNPGDIVKVCPGIYAEQIVISLPLTLKGVSNGRADAVIIEASSSELSGPMAALLLVGNTTGVVISDLVIDGTEAPCSGAIYGIGLYNASATISNSVVRNVTNNVANSCTGWAVAAFNYSNLVFKGNIIHDSGYGVATSYSPAAITGNAISTSNYAINVGLTSGPLNISSNTIQVGVNFQQEGNGVSGINVYQAPAVVSNNAIVVPPSAMAIGIDIEESQNAVVTGNRITGAWSGISLTNSATSVVKGNTIDTSGWVALRVYEANPGGNTVTGNIVNESPCGLSLSASKGDQLGPNSYHNTVATTCN
jgi:parallel beta-helix repeat protein